MLNVVAAGDFNRTEGGGMLVQNLTIHQLPAALSKLLAENQQGRFLGVYRPGEHRLTA